jgi:hypothetical protein
VDIVDILGGLVRRKAGGTGPGADVIKDTANRGSRSSSSSRDAGPADMDRDARELEEMLNVSRDRNARRTSTPAAPVRPTAPTPPARPATPTPPARPTSDSSLRTPSGGSIFGTTQPGAVTGDDPNAQAKARLLVLAMLNAAKCDGQVSPDEERALLQHIDAADPATVQFLRTELAKPLNVREFAWSVPPGMEQQVYSLSLMAIDVDTPQEAAYLKELAHGLRLADNVRDQLHQKYGAPLLK